MNDESAAELSREELIALVAALRAHIAELEILPDRHRYAHGLSPG
jgi:hypothetical protein